MNRAEIIHKLLFENQKVPGVIITRRGDGKVHTIDGEVVHYNGRGMLYLVGDTPISTNGRDEVFLIGKEGVERRGWSREPWYFRRGKEK